MRTSANAWSKAFLSVGVLVLSAHSVKAAAGDVPATAQTDVAILDRARATNSDVYNSLQSFVCNEQMERFRGDMAGQFAQPLDTVKAKLSFEKGVEQYSEVFDDNRPRPGISSLTGAWSEGEFGSLLLQTQQLLSTQDVSFDNFDVLRGQQTAIYRFSVTAEDSPWELVVAGRHYQIPFTTAVWVSVKTGEILKIDRASTMLAPQTHISQIQWSITLDHVALNGAKWLLPITGTYAVLYGATNHREWNQITFTDYQRYGAETALKFN